MRWRARSSSPARRCSGCATAGPRSRTAAETGRLAAQADPDAARLSGARLRSASARRTGTAKRARRMLTGLTLRHDAQGTRARRRSKVSPTRRATSSRPCGRRSWGRMAGDAVHSGRWRHERQRLDHAIPRRHPRCAGRPADVLETTALGAAYLAGWQSGTLCRSRGICEIMAIGAPLYAGDVGCGAQNPVTLDGATRWRALSCRSFPQE